MPKIKEISNNVIYKNDKRTLWLCKNQKLKTYPWFNLWKCSNITYNKILHEFIMVTVITSSKIWVQYYRYCFMWYLDSNCDLFSEKLLIYLIYSVLLKLNHQVIVRWFLLSKYINTHSVLLSIITQYIRINVQCFIIL